MVYILAMGTTTFVKLFFYIKIIPLSRASMLGSELHHASDDKVLISLKRNKLQITEVRLYAFVQKKYLQKETEMLCQM